MVPVEAGQCGRYAGARHLRDVDEYEAVDCVDYHVCGECKAALPVTVIGSAGKRTLCVSCVACVRDGMFPECSRWRVVRGFRSRLCLLARDVGVDALLRRPIPEVRADGVVQVKVAVL